MKPIDQFAQGKPHARPSAAPRVSVIVPVFGVEKYIERCCLSLYAQTFTDFEIVFVNDCSRDRSEAIMLELIEASRHLRIATRVIRHAVNKGISAARETGLAAATGDYVLYVDSDDHVAPDILQAMVARVDQTGADIVYCDYFEVKGGNAHPVSQALPAGDARSITAAMLRQEIVWAPWNKLFRRALAVQNDIHWPEGVNIGEDMVVMTKLCCLAARIEHVARPLYFYNRDNVNSYLNGWSPASCYQNTRAVALLDAYIGARTPDAALQEALAQTKLMARFQMIFAFDDKLRHLVASTFPETDAGILGHKRTPVYWRVALYLIVKKRRLASLAALKAIWLMKKARSLAAMRPLPR